MTFFKRKDYLDFLKTNSKIRTVASNQILGEPDREKMICPEGKSITPCWETLFSVVPPSNSLVSVTET